jgi:hypothetical protein
MNPNQLEPQEHPTEPLLEAGLLQAKQIGDDTNSLLEAIVHQNNENNPEPLLEAQLVTLDKIAKNTDKPVKLAGREEDGNDEDFNENEAGKALWSMLRGPKGAKGDKHTDDELTSLIEPLIPEPIKGEDGKTPTAEELLELLVPYIPEPIKGEDGYTPVKGVDYFDGEDGEDGETPTEEELKKIITPLIPKPLKGEKGKDGKDADPEIVKSVTSLKKQVSNLASSVTSNMVTYRVDDELVSNGYVLNLKAGTNVTLTPVTDKDGASVTISATGAGGGHTIEDEGTPLAQQTNMNFVGAGVTVTDAGGKTVVTIPGGAAGAGDVVGPASVVDSNFPAFDTTTGKLIKDSGSKASDFATTGHNHLLAAGATDVTATAAEVNYTTGVTSAIQTQLNDKAPIDSPNFTTDIYTPLATVGATANFTDFPNAKLVASQADTAESHTYNMGVVGEGKGDAVTTTQWGVGVYGRGVTNGATRSAGVIGDAGVTATGDTGTSIGVRGYADSVHAGGTNVGLYGYAANAGAQGNYALWLEAGNIYSNDAHAWTLYDNQASALSFNSTGKAGILKVVTTDGAEGVTMAGTLAVTGAITGSNLSNTNTGDETGVTLGVLNAAAASKTTPIDADSFPIVDSAAANVIKRLTFTNLKAFLKTYFDTLYLPLDGGTMTGKLVSSGSSEVAKTYTPATGAQTVALDCALNNIHEVSGHASGTAITFTIANAVNSQVFMVSILQGGTTVSTITGWFNTVRWPGGTVPTLTATLNKRDTFGFRRTGANTYDGFIISQNS